MVDLSIIIISYNTASLLDDCLKSVFKAVAPSGGLEVVVVDNHSQDESVKLVKTKYPAVKLIENKTNSGFAAANNQGVKISSGKYLLFLNSDTKISSDSLVKPLKFIKTHPQVGGLTVKLKLPSGELDHDNHRAFPTPWVALTLFAGYKKLYFQLQKNFNRIHAIELTAGSYLMMPMKLFNHLGGWDETYFFYGEDIDLCYRIHQAGYKIIYYPKVEVIHYKGASSGLRKESSQIARPPKATRVKVARESIRAMEIFYKKFYSSKYPKLLTGLVLIGIRLKGFFRILKHQLS
jgi:GT2 family glycosyltransferase